MQATGTPILLSLNATVTSDGEQPESIHLMTSGELFVQGQGYVLRYEEQLDEEAPPSTIQLSMEDGLISMLRSGDYSSNMLFRKGQRYEGQYGTPFGEMDLGIYCTKADFDIDDLGGLVRLQYQLDINGQYVSMHEMELRFLIKEDGHGFSEDRYESPC